MPKRVIVTEYQSKNPNEGIIVEDTSGLLIPNGKNKFKKKNRLYQQLSKQEISAIINKNKNRIK